MLLWIAIKPVNKVILGICISFERNMLVAEQSIKGVVKKYGKHPFIHPLSADGG